ALARRAAAPVAVRDDDLRALERFDVEQVLLLRAVGVEAPVVKQHVAILRAARHLVEARRAQLVGVDVRLVDRRRDAGQLGKWLHKSSRIFTSTSRARRSGGPSMLLRRPSRD